MAKFVKPSKSTQAAKSTQALPTIASVQADKAAQPVQPAESTESTPTVQPAKVVKPRKAIIRVTHPALKPDVAGTATVKLTAYPADWSYIYHKAITKDDFASEYDYLMAQADFYDLKAKKLRQEADDVKSGRSEVTKSVKKVRSMMDSLPTMLAELAGKGVNVSDLLNNMNDLLKKQTVPSA